MGLGLGQSPISRSGVGASEVNVYIHGYIIHYSGQCMVFLLLWRAQIAPPYSQSSEGVLGLEGCCKGVLPSQSLILRNPIRKALYPSAGRPGQAGKLAIRPATE